MTHEDDEVLRTGYAVASDLVDQARLEAQAIIDEAERRADLMIMHAERVVSAKRSEGAIFLQKARAVLEIAQQRAAGRGLGLAFAELAPDADGRPGASADEVEVVDLVPGSAELPSGFDRLLVDAVSAAVSSSIASTRLPRH